MIVIRINMIIIRIMIIIMYCITYDMVSIMSCSALFDYVLLYVIFSVRVYYVMVFVLYCIIGYYIIVYYTCVLFYVLYSTYLK